MPCGDLSPVLTLIIILTTDAHRCTLIKDNKFKTKLTGMKEIKGIKEPVSGCGGNGVSGKELTVSD